MHLKNRLAPLVLLGLAFSMLAGCGDGETKADPAAIDAKNAQRQAMPAGGAARPTNAGAPGAPAPTGK